MEYNIGDFMYYLSTGEIVEILDYYKQETGFIKHKVYKVGSLKDYKVENDMYSQYYEVRPYALLPINDLEVQFLLKSSTKPHSLSKLYALIKN